MPNSPLNIRVCQPSADFTSTCLQKDVNDHPVSLLEIWDHHIDFWGTSGFIGGN